jgi:putative ABC transport system permease protein
MAMTESWHWKIVCVARMIIGRGLTYFLMVAGLTLGFCTALVIGLYIREELTFDRFIPGADQTYLVATKFGPKGQPLVENDMAPAGVARWVRTDLPEVDSAARLIAADSPLMTARKKTRGQFYWADPNIFDILPFPVEQGDLRTALATPGSVVLTQRMAIAYFGRADAIGKTLVTQDRNVLHVTAILKDFPANSHLNAEIFVSGRSPYSGISILDGSPGALWPNAYTYVRLKPGASVIETERALLRIALRRWEGSNVVPVGFELIRMPDLHFHSPGEGQMKPRGQRELILSLCVVALILICHAGINLAGLILAEANERGDEMALRAALGARRHHLILDVIQEALWVSGFSALTATALAEHILPALNRAFDLGLSLWNEPFGVLAAIIGVACCLGLVSGLGSALMVSRPFGATKSALRLTTSPQSSGRRRGWIVAQLALVIVLLIAAATMSRQWVYATGAALNFDGSNVLMVKNTDWRFRDSETAFKANLRTLKGVEAVADSFGVPTLEHIRPVWIKGRDGKLITLTRNSVAPEFFKVFHVPFLAGENLTGTYLVPDAPKDIILNRSAAAALGFSAPVTAIGKTIEYDTDQMHVRSRVVGVIPDMRFATVYEPVQPMIFDNFGKFSTHFNIRISPDEPDRTIGRIDQLWDRLMGSEEPIIQSTFHDYLMGQYSGLRHQILIARIVSFVSVVLSMLGLVGLSIFQTRHQVREMAIRRALGATFLDIIADRLTYFYGPILIANLMAWPVAWIVMSSWLNSFADHVSLSIGDFFAAAAISSGFTLIVAVVYSVVSTMDTSISDLGSE